MTETAHPTVRSRVLQEADRLTGGDRNNQYGPPTQDFDRTAALWTTYFKDKLPEGVRFKAYDVAIFMILLKVSRISWTPDKEDSWTDVAGYAGCGAECALQEPEANDASR